MKLARIAALLVAVVVAAAAVWSFSRPPAAPVRPGASSASPVAGTAGDATGAPSFSPETGTGARPVPPPGVKPPAPAGPAPPPALPTALPDVGTHATPGREVDVVVPWRRGEKNRFRYEIEDLELRRDRRTEMVEPNWVTWRVLLEVVEGDGSGAARLRLTVESMRVRGFRATTGLPFDVDTRVPDNGQLDDPELGRRVRPVLTRVGRPVEFRLDATGTVTDVDGWEDWRERHLTEVQRIVRGAVNDVPDAPTRETVRDEWSEYLFPRIGGGRIAAGARRPWNRLQPLLLPWALDWKGTVDATRDDPDAFRVDVVATPTAVHTGGQATTDFVAGIQAMRAFPTGEGYRAAYRIGRSPAAPIEAQIDSAHEVWISEKSGRAPGEPQYAPSFTEILRRAIVRRTSEE